MKPNQPPPRRFRYQISTLLLVIIIAALSLAGWVHWRRSQQVPRVRGQLTFRYTATVGDIPPAERAEIGIDRKAR
jgi:hypothetical protein